MPKENGGLRLVNIVFKHKALLSQWAFLAPTSLFFNVITSNQLILNLGQFVWKCNLNSKDVNSVVKNESS